MQKIIFYYWKNEKYRTYPAMDFLKVILVGVWTYAGMKTGF